MIHNLLFTNETGNRDMAIGLIVAKHLHIHQPVPALESMLRVVLKQRRETLNDHEQQMREAVWDMLGIDSSAGQMKPASEILLQKAESGHFPRVNSAVDIMHMLSLEYVVPISLWDLDLAAASHYIFRVGREGEKFIFNEGDQSMDLEGLTVGCRVRSKGDEPIISPVKDAEQTKTTPSTVNIGAAIYFPLKAAPKDELRSIIREFIVLLDGITSEAPEYDIL